MQVYIYAGKQALICMYVCNTYICINADMHGVFMYVCLQECMKSVCT